MSWDCSMRLIAVHIPERIVTDIERLVEKGLYPNRSETIRIAIRDLLKRELWEQEKIEQKPLIEVAED
ncbi:MAG: ribbon-helix-helix domain-containing protein [Candidatus Thorarchaeota archaeon]